MRKELDNRLCERFPTIFRDRHGSPIKTSMCWGFPGDGWFNLIWNLCEKIEKIDTYKEVVATQVKEKFGGLRFHIGLIPEEYADAVYALIDEAEEESFDICEGCGNPGVLRKGGWLKVLCDTCNTKGDDDATV